MPVPDGIPIAYEPNYRTEYVGTWAGGQFLGNVLRQSGGRSRRSSQWFAYLHEFDSRGAYVRSHTATTGMGEGGLRAALAFLRERLNDLPGLAYGDIAIKPFRAEYEGTVYGLIIEDGHGAGEGGGPMDWAELYPDRLGFHAPWDGTYDT